MLGRSGNFEGCVLNQEYALITAARNEQEYIGFPAEAVASQTVRPRKWVIVSDGSTDATDQVVKDYTEKWNFIQFVRGEEGNGRSGFASKVSALNTGYECLRNTDYDFIGHLDADVSFEPDCYERLLAKFRENPRLGLAGGFIYESRGGRFHSRPTNRGRSVAGAVQLFRRKCYEDVGSVVPFTMGGEDAYAEVMARMKGWHVEAFPDIKIFHHRRSTKARGVMREFFLYGAMDYALGYHPFFEILKGISRIKERPPVTAALLRMSGFVWSYISRRKRPVPAEFIRYVRREQLELLKTCFHMARGASGGNRKLSNGP